MSEFIDMLKALFIGACVVAVVLVIIYFCCFSCESSHVKTENNPALSVHLEDIHYKGHIYILLDAPYSNTLVHAEHCKCKN